MRRDHGHAPRLGLHGFDHVQNEGVIAFGLRRDAAFEATELVILRRAVSPLLQREGRIGDHHVDNVSDGHRHRAVSGLRMVSPHSMR